MNLDPKLISTFPAIVRHATELAKENYNTSISIHDPNMAHPCHESWEEMAATVDVDGGELEPETYTRTLAVDVQIALLCDVTRRASRDALLWLIEEEAKAGRCFGAGTVAEPRAISPGLIAAACEDQGRIFPADYRDDAERVYELACWLLDSNFLRECEEVKKAEETRKKPTLNPEWKMPPPPDNSGTWTAYAHIIGMADGVDLFWAPSGETCPEHDGSDGRLIPWPFGSDDIAYPVDFEALGFEVVS